MSVEVMLTESTLMSVWLLVATKEAIQDPVN